MVGENVNASDLSAFGGLIRLERRRPESGQCLTIYIKPMNFRNGSSSKFRNRPESYFNGKGRFLQELEFHTLQAPVQEPGTFGPLTGPNIVAALPKIASCNGWRNVQTFTGADVLGESTRDRIIAILRQSQMPGKYTSAAQIARRLGLARFTANWHLHELAKSGFARHCPGEGWEPLSKSKSESVQ